MSRHHARCGECIAEDSVRSLPTRPRIYVKLRIAVSAGHDGRDARRTNGVARWRPR